MQFFFIRFLRFFCIEVFDINFQVKRNNKNRITWVVIQSDYRSFCCNFILWAVFFSFIRHLSYNCSIIISLVFRPAFNLLRIGWKLLGMSLGCDMALHTNHLMIGSLVHSHKKNYSHDSKTHSRCMQLLHSNGQLAGQMKYIVSAK